MGIWDVDSGCHFTAGDAGLRSDYFEVENDGYGDEGRVIRAGQ